MSHLFGYALADAMGFGITHDGQSLRGGREKQVNLSGMSISIQPKIVSSLVRSNVWMVMVKVVGNLALFATVKPGKGLEMVDLYVLNLAKMDAVDNWLETHKPSSVNEVLKALGKAVVKGFVLDGKKWVVTTE